MAGIHACRNTARRLVSERLLIPVGPVLDRSDWAVWAKTARSVDGLLAGHNGFGNRHTGQVLGISDCSVFVRCRRFGSIGAQTLPGIPVSVSCRLVCPILLARTSRG